MSSIKFPSPNTQLPVAPVIAGFREHYFVTEGSGKTLTYYSELPAQHPDDDSLQIWSLIFSTSLVKHWDNFLTMVCPMAVLPCEISPYDPDTDKITLLDWENGRRWPEFYTTRLGFTHLCA